VLLGHLEEAGFNDFFEEGGGEGFVGGEADGTFAHFEAGELGAEFVDDEVAHGEEAAMVFEGGDGADVAVVFEGGDAVADGFGLCALHLFDGMFHDAYLVIAVSGDLAKGSPGFVTERFELGALRLKLLLHVAEVALKLVGGRNSSLEGDDGNLGGCRSGRGGRGLGSDVSGCSHGKSGAENGGNCGYTLHANQKLLMTFLQLGRRSAKKAPSCL